MSMGISMATVNQPQNLEANERIRWILFSIILATSFARLSNMDQPFGRTYEATACGPIVCAARNTVRYGLFATRFGYVENCDVVPPERFTFYSHHPALVPLSLAPVVWLFGDHPWCYRLPAAICSVLATGLLFLILARKFDWTVGAVAAFFYAACPFSWLVGDMPDVVGPHLVLFGLATIECYSRWSDTREKKWFVAAVLAWILAAFSDWPAFVIPPILAIHFIIANPPRFWWRIIPFGLLAAAVLVFHALSLTHGGDSSVFRQFFFRMHGNTDNGHPITLADWYHDALLNYVLRTFTAPVCALAGIYLISIVLLALHQIKRLARHDTVLLMLAWGCLHVMIGFQSSHQHLWVWCVMLPAMCAAAALAATMLFKLLPALLQKPLPARALVALSAGVFMIGSHLRASAIDEATLTMQPMIYTLRDLGTFIHDMVPSGQGVLTSDMTDESTQTSEPALWYYADRQVRNNIRSVQQLDASLGEGDYPLYYRMVQKGGPAPLWFVMPAEHRLELPELTAVLDQRYAHWFINGFMLYYFYETPEQQKAKEGH
jgi:hypothetical protein